MDICGFYMPTWLATLLVILFTVLFAWYKWVVAKYDTFKKLGINGPKPVFLMGNIQKVLSQGIHKHDLNLRKEYGDIVGLFQGRTPIMMVYDMDMLKQICIKEFSSFQNRMSIEFGDPLFDNMLTIIKDDHWKHVRTLLTPTFSSGRLRRMCNIVNKNGLNMVSNLEENAQKGSSFEMRERCGAFTMDTIAGTGFGIDLNSQVDLQNPFVRHANKAFDFSEAKIRLLIFLVVPYLLKYLAKVGIGNFPEDARQFYISVLKQAIQNRKDDEDSDKASDFLQLMMNAHREKPDDLGKLDAYDGSEEFVRNNEGRLWSKIGLTEDEILAQGFIFLLAGYETTATTLSFLFYSLAMDQEIQDRVVAEIDKVMEGHEEPNYDLVSQMKYLEQCIEETLRMYPAAPRMDRACNKDITINGVFIPKDMIIGLPIYALQNDPNVFPNPSKFDPDRFTPEEKAKRHTMSFMAFGSGPRMCIGMRLAQLELKMCAVHMLRAYRVIPADNTPAEIEFQPFQTKAKGGIPLKVEKRHN